MPAESPPTDKTTDNQLDQNSILRRLSQLEHLVALLFIGACGEDLTDDEFDAWDAAVAWAYEDFDGPALLATLPSPYEARGGTRKSSPDEPTEPTEQQGTLFPTDDERQSDGPK